MSKKSNKSEASTEHKKRRFWWITGIPDFCPVFVFVRCRLVLFQERVCHSNIANTEQQRAKKKSFVSYVMPANYKLTMNCSIPLIVSSFDFFRQFIFGRWCVCALFDFRKKNYFVGALFVLYLDYTLFVCSILFV